MSISTASPPSDSDGPPPLNSTFPVITNHLPFSLSIYQLSPACHSSASGLLLSTAMIWSSPSHWLFLPNLPPPLLFLFGPLHFLLFFSPILAPIFLSLSVKLGGFFVWFWSFLRLFVSHWFLIERGEFFDERKWNGRFYWIINNMFRPFKPPFSCCFSRPPSHSSTTSPPHPITL